MKIGEIETIMVDIPTRRPHAMSFGTVTLQNFVIVRMRTDAGLEGLGEAAIPGGPTWNEESAETVKAVIDRYLAPVLLGQDPFQVERLLREMDRAAKGNHFAKAALEFACFDLMGRALRVPVSALLGGVVRDRIPYSWSLATGDTDQEIAEARTWADGGSTLFKVKVGVRPAAEDLGRLERIAAALPPPVRVRADANQGWDEPTTLRLLPRLEATGIDLLEQPVPRWNRAAMARITAASRLPIMADESVGTIQECLEAARLHLAHVWSLKLTKAGGLLRAKQAAAIAEAAGVPCYVGNMIETAIGTAAYAHFAASTPVVTEGCELFGPLLLADDLTREGIRYQDGHVLVPDGPGLGVTLDEAKLERYARRA
ncbi:MAG TPA: muconate cycloisomerase family protein [Methylomirabilota bacterium]|jgi:muconate cycloisomerase|nr:muconate cycloisomerase family protein [Methylomirabilota bacterium]